MNKLNNYFIVFLKLNIKYFQLLYFLFCVLSYFSCMKEHNYKKGFLKNNYKLVWNELFNGDEIDIDKWNIEVREHGWVNNELQAYTNRKKNLFVKNNNLFIRGIKEKHGVAQYTSGRINTSKKFNWK